MRGEDAGRGARPAPRDRAGLGVVMGEPIPSTRWVTAVGMSFLF